MKSSGLSTFLVNEISSHRNFEDTGWHMTKVQDQALFPRLLNRNRKYGLITAGGAKTSVIHSILTELANGTLNKLRFSKCQIIVRSNKRRGNLEQWQLAIVTKLNSVNNKARRV